jgi:hypothetical protein
MVMPATEQQYSKDELDRMEREVYERAVKPRLRPEDDGKFVAVDALTGEFEVDESELPAIRRLRARVPAAEIWLERVGEPTAHRI